ncbi:hypothetical protein [Aquimarina longa]|uniref:hypothetical protein n=1 Tax=Aquimarina longa TaxID=1080221 RepID=UPI000780F41A|nr:hypothetical protein [Aquimarina longa]
MKLSAILVIVLLSITNNTIHIKDIRESYKTCNDSREKALQFFKLTHNSLQNKGAIYKGYHGAALALKASFSWNPYKKLSFFNKGRKMIDSAILSEPDNIELRMIRISIQSNAPKIVGYYKNIDEDRNLILSKIDTVNDKELKQYIDNFIAYSDVFYK